MFVNKLIIKCVFECVFITVQQNLEQKKLKVWKKHRRQKFAAWVDKVESKYEGTCLFSSQIARAALVIPSQINQKKYF